MGHEGGLLDQRYCNTGASSACVPAFVFFNREDVRRTRTQQTRWPGKRELEGRPLVVNSNLVHTPALENNSCLLSLSPGVPISVRFSVELGRLPLVKTAAKMARGLCYNNKDRLLAGMIIAGWDPVDGGSVYEIPLGGTMIKQKFAIGGSGSTYM